MPCHKFALCREGGGDGAVEQEGGCREKAFLKTIPNSKVIKLLYGILKYSKYSVGLTEVLPCLNTGDVRWHSCDCAWVASMTDRSV